MSFGPKFSTLSTLAVALLLSASAYAQNNGPGANSGQNGGGGMTPYPECSGGFCGTPNMKGGGGCSCSCGCSILINRTDIGQTYSYADDYDSDGIEDNFDNCPFVYNPDQADVDGDGVGDACDNCPHSANKDQKDTNDNGVGDACDPDIDGDQIMNPNDNCPTVYNPDQRNTYNSPAGGDACNPDIDGDGLINSQDPCPYDPTNTPGSALCLEKDDPDKDGVPTPVDNCPGVYNPDQADLNHDGIGDACDPDIDGDHVVNSVDNCPRVANPDQKDSDRDGIGDACDDRFCYVVFPADAAKNEIDKNNCADPNLTFTVLTYSTDRATVGDPYQLHIFANRENAAMRYTWTVISGPDNNHSHINNPRGSVTYSTPYEYHYLTDQVAEFYGDTAGKYTIQLSAELVFPDTMFPNNNTSRTQFELTVADNGKSGGCVCTTPNAQKGGAAVGLMLIGVVLAARGRKRNSK
jgi:hypothetical protein